MSLVIKPYTLYGCDILVGSLKLSVGPYMHLDLMYRILYLLGYLDHPTRCPIVFIPLNLQFFCSICGFPLMALFVQDLP